jgi:hypothetical protein
LIFKCRLWTDIHGSWLIRWRADWIIIGKVYEEKEEEYGAAVLCMGQNLLQSVKFYLVLTRNSTIVLRCRPTLRHGRSFERTVLILLKRPRLITWKMEVVIDQVLDSYARPGVPGGCSWNWCAILILYFTCSQIWIRLVNVNTYSFRLHAA